MIIFRTASDAFVFPFKVAFVENTNDRYQFQKSKMNVQSRTLYERYQKALCFSFLGGIKLHVLMDYFIIVKGQIPFTNLLKNYLPTSVLTLNI